jgi:hypothetical protein
MHLARARCLLRAIAILQHRVITAAITRLTLDNIVAAINVHGAFELDNGIAMVMRKVVPHLAININNPLNVVAVAVETLNAIGDLDSSVATRGNRGELVVVRLTRLHKGVVVTGVLASSGPGVYRDTAVIDEGAAVCGDEGQGRECGEESSEGLHCFKVVSKAGFSGSSWDALKIVVMLFVRRRRFVKVIMLSRRVG